MDYKKSEYIGEFSEKVESLNYDNSELQFVRENLLRVVAGEDTPTGCIVAMGRALVKYVNDEWIKTQSRNQ